MAKKKSTTTPSKTTKAKSTRKPKAPKKDINDMQVADGKDSLAQSIEEVKDLEDEITGYETRVGKYTAEIEDLTNLIAEKKDGIKKAEGLVTKYKDQQMNVRNNREYDAITKEIELQELEVQICEKKIKEAGFSIDNKKEEIAATQEILAGRKIDLENKKKTGASQPSQI